MDHRFKKGLFLLITVIITGTGLTACTETPPEEPDPSHFRREILTEGLNEPMQMAILPNSDVLFVERRGGVKYYDADQAQLKEIAHFDVFSDIEDGLLGVTLDPEFETNNHIYFYYSVVDTAINRLTRMELHGDRLDRSTEVTILDVPTQREHCCHSAGYLEFGPDGTLFIATGDNTNADDPYKIGYPPVDERPGHELADDQATAANTNDLRGKILRIIPEAEGGYSIPEGNLYPEGTSKTRPEIYVMGLRNPFRFTVDQKTGTLYWGDVGPNTIVEGRDGTLMSYDEINRATEPGFFGWPYFLGNNDAFPMYDFETEEEGERKDPDKPLNVSPNNTGLRELPPAEPAMIWYGREESEKFPLVGSGGASLMAGEVYYRDQFPENSYRLPEYYDGKLFIYEWIRNWIMAVTLDDEGDYVSMEPFLDHMEFAAPMDFRFASDGSLYILEYGSDWFSENDDAKLVRIVYDPDNPVDLIVDEDGEAGTATLASEELSPAEELITSSNCRSCHSLTEVSAGPSFMSISERYAGQEGSLEYLSGKIINGGSGVWGNIGMPPNPQLSESDANEIVHYILSLTD